MAESTQDHEEYSYLATLQDLKYIHYALNLVSAAYVSGYVKDDIVKLREKVDIAIRERMEPLDIALKRGE